MATTSSPRSHKTNIFLALDLRIVIGILLIIITAMLILWRPWGGASDRTISVTGEAALRAEPDEYIFSPAYQFKNADQDAALAQLIQKNDDVVTGLKQVGVPENNIKTNSGGAGEQLRGSPESGETTYTLAVTVTVGNRELAQKVQDYLLTTSPLGAVSPQATFSDAKRRQLETQTREQATTDARNKAEQSARNLGFRLGRVKEVADDSGFGASQGRIVPGGAEDAAQSPIQPGQNEVLYSVTVVYYVR